MRCICCFFFFNDTATTEIYTLSLHDALPIFFVDLQPGTPAGRELADGSVIPAGQTSRLVSVSDVLATLRYDTDRKSTRLNSSHANISYAVFCLKKKRNNNR